MKILHCSDLHLGKRPVGYIGEYSNIRFDDYFKSFEYIVDEAIRINVNVFVIAGDFFDKRELSPEVLERTELILLKLQENGIKCIAIEGNHDNISEGSESASWIIYLENKKLIQRPYIKYEEDGIQFKTIKIHNTTFYGLGYPCSDANEVLGELSEVLEIKENNVNYVIIHTAIGSTEYLAGTINGESINKLIGKADYIAGGHFHTFSSYPKDNPIFFVPGSGEYWDLGEIGQEKCFIVYDTKHKSWEKYPIQTRPARKISLTTEADSDEEFMTEFTNFMNELAPIVEGELILLDITLKKHIVIDFTSIEDTLKEKGALWVKTNFTSPGLGIHNYDSGILGIENIERDIIKSWSAFADYPEETFDLLSQVKTAVSDKDVETIFQSFDAFAGLILGENDEN